MQLLAGFSVIASILTLVGIYGRPGSFRGREASRISHPGRRGRRTRRYPQSDRRGERPPGGRRRGGWFSGRALPAQLLRTFLYGVEPTDPATLLAVAGVFAVAGLVATLVPVRRAMSVAPESPPGRLRLLC